MKCKIYKGALLIGILSSICVSCTSVTEERKNIQCEEKINASEDSFNNNPVTIIPFKTESGWGYDVYKKGEKIIHQTHIPVIQGEIPFKTKNDALKVATLIASKMLYIQGIPTVTLQELDSLEIKYKTGI